MSDKFRYDLLDIYGEYMLLKLHIDTEDEDLYDKYVTAICTHHTKMVQNIMHIDAGFDLFTPEDQTLVASKTNKVDYKVTCSAMMIQSNYENGINNDFGFNTGFYMYPRSSISKTNLRLANNTGIIDAGYRGHLIGMFDLINTTENVDINKFDRHLQICAPNLKPVVVELVSNAAHLGLNTARKDGGFGSTGV